MFGVWSAVCCGVSFRKVQLCVCAVVPDLGKCGEGKHDSSEFYYACSPTHPCGSSRCPSLPPPSIHIAIMAQLPILNMPKPPACIPVFLAPAFSCAPTITSHTIRSFSSSSSSHQRKKIAGRTGVAREVDANKKRGVSAMRSTGPRKPLNILKLYPELPQPVKFKDTAEARKNEVPINPNHGLYGFFNEKREVVVTGEQEALHGRAWTTTELSRKSFEDLHKLYWVCLKELNAIATRKAEHRRLKAGYGLDELGAREREVEITNRNILAVLRNRQTMYEEARHLLASKEMQDLFPDEKAGSSTYGPS